jgi:predicted nucleic acid-binding protein
MPEGVLLDTGFLIRLLDSSQNLHQNAKSYYKYFLDKEITLKCSTIAIAEYCVKGNIDDLPLKDFQIIPFNLNHAIKAGEFAGFIFKNKGSLNVEKRNIIPNDTNLFAQAESEQDIKHYITSDSESIKIYNLLKDEFKLNFELIDLNTPSGNHFGFLDLDIMPH